MTETETLVGRLVRRFIVWVLSLVIPRAQGGQLGQIREALDTAMPHRAPEWRQKVWQEASDRTATRAQRTGAR